MEYTLPLLQFEILLLILMRISCFMVTAPFFNMPNTPVRIKIAFAFFVSVIVYSLMDFKLEYNDIIEYSALVIKEAVAGLLIGFSAQICTQAIHFAGRIIDMDIGLAMANVLDPTSREQVGLTGTFYYNFVILLLLVSDLHTFMLKAIIETFELIPIGSMTLNPMLYNTGIEIISNYFIIGFRIALPVFAAILLLNAIMAILVRVAPQMNMFSVGVQLKILVGLGVIMLTVWLLPSISTFVGTQIKLVLKNVVEGMRNYGTFTL